ncbi:hypothetical protein PZB75_04660 [Streptomyces sp. AM 4-1-1]|uniref:hypothetical protein n=1 Tax=unclassified Streptomyces TaxID=2593676 RepID=UPI0023B907E8|nr:hypothetical protein [Streptomyces sp. AM 4-1-1]WEH32731.1 hypothetical protein PZB75_04660 [Streptomyces sp. AM 4-1-1]
MSDWMPGPGRTTDGVPRDVPDEAPGGPRETPPHPAPADGGRHEDTGPAASPYEPAPPAPLGVARTPTGNAEVDARLERLADADHLAADGHTEVYEDVHRGLRDALTALDARPAAGPVPAPTPTGDNAYTTPYNNRS